MDLFSCLVIRYSDFVVHEINKQGNIVRLDDLSIPSDVEVRYQSLCVIQLAVINYVCNRDVLIRVFFSPNTREVIKKKDSTLFSAFCFKRHASQWLVFQQLSERLSSHLMQSKQDPIAKGKNVLITRVGS